jgi:thiamine biosynthesis protein ThiC
MDINMDYQGKNRITNALRTLAEQEEISDEEVRNEIALAISLALKSEDSSIQEFWKNIPCVGEAPTVEEVINHIILNLPQQS